MDMLAAVWVFSGTIGFQMRITIDTVRYTAAWGCGIGVGIWLAGWFMMPPGVDVPASLFVYGAVCICLSGIIQLGAVVFWGRRSVPK